MFTRTKNNYHFEFISTFIKNFLVLLLLYTLTRVVFTVYNFSFFNNLMQEDFFTALKGALLFDISTIVYVNIIYILLMFTPISPQIRHNNIYKNTTKWVFIITNSIALLWNIFDTVYFEFTQRRTTIGIFREFSNDNNITSIILNGASDYWPITLIGLFVVALLYYFYTDISDKIKNHSSKRYWTISTLLFVFILAIGVLGIRGGIRYNMKALSTTSVFQYIKYPADAPVILNTPFTLLQTATGRKMPNFNYFKNETEAKHIFNTYHQPAASSIMTKHNVVIIMLESFSSAYSGLLSKETIGKQYQGYTPFLDSLMTKSLIFETSIANGTKSIDVLPSVLASVPRIVEPYFLSDYSNNKISSLAGDLKQEGYYSAFFHGAENGSLGLWNFAKKSGFENYFGKNEYDNNKDFDGTWAIWDKEFFEFYANKMNEFKEPFITAFFSATSHNPFKLPEKYKKTFKEGSMPIYKCIRYSDFALKSFFDKASKTTWFKNTLFVICADHTSANDITQCQTNMGRKSIPIIFYFPTKIKPEIRHEIAQQIDIKPSVLGFLGYNKPYIAFGRDVFHTTKKEAYGIFENNSIYEYLTDTYLLQFDGKKAIGLYRYKSDPKLKYNELNTRLSLCDSLTVRLKAALQVYQFRIKNNMLTEN